MILEPLFPNMYNKGVELLLTSFLLITLKASV